VRVAIDVTPMASAVRTGIGQTVAGLLNVLPNRAAAAGIEILPYALSLRARQARTMLPPQTRCVPIPARLLLPSWACFGRPSIRPFLGRPDLVHATNYLTPPGMRAVVWVHDVAFMHNASMGSADARQYGATVRRAIRNGATVVTGAFAIASDIRSVFADDFRRDDQIVVVPLALPTLPPAAPSLPAGVPTRPYALSLGTLEPRKNHVGLIAAFARCSATTDLDLVIAGPAGSALPAIESALTELDIATRNRIHVIGPVSDQERVALLTHARLLAYPSLAEGFGLPILEAMAVDTPVVASNVGSIPEVAGDAAVLIEPNDTDELAATIVRLHEDESLRRTLIERGRSQAARFTWEHTADGLIACYQQAMTR
jgi:glycosyltransferase involved in cell wall biosynthesis